MSHFRFALFEVFKGTMTLAAGNMDDFNPSPITKKMTFFCGYVAFIYYITTFLIAYLVGYAEGNVQCLPISLFIAHPWYRIKYKIVFK